MYRRTYACCRLTNRLYFKKRQSSCDTQSSSICVRAFARRRKIRIYTILARAIAHLGCAYGLFAIAFYFDTLLALQTLKDSRRTTQEAGSAFTWGEIANNWAAVTVMGVEQV